MVSPFSQLHFWISKNKNERESYNLSKILNFAQTKIHGRDISKIKARLASKDALGKGIKSPLDWNRPFESLFIFVIYKFKI